MKNYIYRFNDGTQSKIEVDEKWADVLAELDTIERRQQWVVDKHNISLDRLNGIGFEPKSKDKDFEDIIAEKESSEKQKKAVSKLSKKQQDLFRLYFKQGMTTRQIASIKGISQPAIVQQLATIKKKIKKIY